MSLLPIIVVLSKSDDELVREGNWFFFLKKTRLSYIYIAMLQASCKLDRAAALCSISHSMHVRTLVATVHTCMHAVRKKVTVVYVILIFSMTTI